MNVFIFFTLIAVVLSFALMIIVILKRAQDRSVYLIFTFGACFMYSFGYLMEITASHADTAFYALKVSYFGMPFILPFTFLYLWDVYQKKRLSWQWHVLMFVIPLSSLFCMQLYPNIKLYYVDIDFISNGWISNNRIYPGVLYHINMAYIYFITLLCIILILNHHEKDSKYRTKQTAVFLLALLIPVATTIPYVASGELLRYDFTPMATSVTMSLLMYSMFYTNFLLVVPLGREQVLEVMSDAFLVCNAVDQFLYANQAGLALFPGLAHANPGEPLTNLPGVNQKEEEIRLQVQGQNRIYKVSYTFIQPDTKKGGYCIVYHDISQKAEMLEKLRIRGTYDELMGILNRETFIAAASTICRDPDLSCALLMFDIDYFKNVNDTMGHAAGDLVLRNIADVVNRFLHEDEIFGRYGGEELLIMFKNLDKKEALRRSEDLRKSVNASVFDFEGQKLSVNISIGLAYSPMGQAESFDLMLKKADQALYFAKENGRNQSWLFEEPA